MVGQPPRWGELRTLLCIIAAGWTYIIPLLGIITLLVYSHLKIQKTAVDVHFNPTGRFPINAMSVVACRGPIPSLRSSLPEVATKLQVLQGDSTSWGLPLRRAAKKKKWLGGASFWLQKAPILIKSYQISCTWHKIGKTGQLWTAVFCHPSCRQTGSYDYGTMAIPRKRPLRHSSGGHHGNEGRDFSELTCWTDYL